MDLRPSGGGAGRRVPVCVLGGHRGEGIDDLEGVCICIWVVTWILIWVGGRVVVVGGWFRVGVSSRHYALLDGGELDMYMVMVMSEWYEERARIFGRNSDFRE